jgi:undecaprenyl-diphosphatase
MSKTKKKKRAGKALLAADRKAHQAVRPYQDSPPVKALSWLSEMGDQPPMLALSGSVLAWGVVRRDGRLVRAGGRMIASHLLATWIKNIVKHRVDRTRPFAASTDQERKPKAGKDSSKEKTSFPSGHSAGALAVAQAFAREFPEHRGKALSGAGAIALAQIPRCAHYPTDVGAGVAIGWLSELAVDRAAALAGAAIRR